MQFFWKHLHSNKGDENVSKLIWIVIAFVIGALLLSTLSVAFKTDGTVCGWLNSSIESWFGEIDGRDGSVSGGTGGSGGGLPGGNPNEGGGNEATSLYGIVVKYDDSIKALTTNNEKDGKNYSSEFDESKADDFILTSYMSETGTSKGNQVFTGNATVMTKSELATINLDLANKFADGTYILLEPTSNAYIGVDTNGNVIIPFDFDPSSGLYMIFDITKNNNNNDDENSNKENSNHNGTEIPEGAVYYVGVTETELNPDGYADSCDKVLTAGCEFPETVSVGDVYVFEDYEYRYNMFWDDEWFDITDMIGDEETFAAYGICEGWYVQVLYREKEAYSNMLSMINNEPVTVAFATFIDCPNLKEPPVLSQNLISMSHTFFYNEMGVSKLTVAPAIPKSVQVMTNCFTNCDSLKIAPVLPDNLIYAQGLFSGCTNLSGYHGNENANGDFSEYVLPSSLLNMDGIFDWCKLLTDTPVIPENVIDISNAFRGCKLLKEAPAIPDSVIYSEGTFANCDSLLSAPIIPASVTNMDYAFYNCTSITSPIKINSKNVSSANNIFNTNIFNEYLTVTVLVPAGSTTYKTLINLNMGPNVTIETF